MLPAAAAAAVATDTSYGTMHTHVECKCICKMMKIDEETASLPAVVEGGKRH